MNVLALEKEFDDYDERTSYEINKEHENELKKQKRYTRDYDKWFASLSEDDKKTVLGWTQ